MLPTKTVTYLMHKDNMVRTVHLPPATPSLMHQ